GLRPEADIAQLPGLGRAGLVELQKDEGLVADGLEDARGNLAALKGLIIEDGEQLRDRFRCGLTSTRRTEGRHRWCAAGWWGRAGVPVVDSKRHRTAGHIQLVKRDQTQPVALVAGLAPGAPGPVRCLVPLEASEAAARVGTGVGAERAFNADPDVDQGLHGRRARAVELQEHEATVRDPPGDERGLLATAERLVREGGSQGTDVSAGQRAGDRGPNGGRGAGRYHSRTLPQATARGERGGKCGDQRTRTAESDSHSRTSFWGAYCAVAGSASLGSLDSQGSDCLVHGAPRTAGVSADAQGPAGDQEQHRGKS